MEADACGPLLRFACTSTSCVAADAVVLPMDFLKTRLQLQNELVPPSAPKLGPLSMAAKVARVEGPTAFWSGLPAAAARQASYGGLCFFAYPYVRDALAGDAAAPLWAQISAGALSGGGAAALANPTDVVKRAFLGGLAPNVARAAAVNGAGIAAYDSSKRVAGTFVGEGRPIAGVLVAALCGGLATAAAGCPFDIVKTRLMARRADDAGAYRGPADCVARTVRAEGVLALYKGFLPVYGRQAPFNVLNYVFMEWLLDVARRR
ncbi:oxidative phosphorylation uncoupler [Aureococcus anophagefferens]|nr:oxidative phosphorylation uncoupler [Aureococcus anophagefferens]